MKKKTIRVDYETIANQIADSVEAILAPCEFITIGQRDRIDSLVDELSNEIGNIIEYNIWWAERELL